MSVCEGTDTICFEQFAASPIGHVENRGRFLRAAQPSIVEIVLQCRLPNSLSC